MAEPTCFQCIAADGLQVRLTKARYCDHILAGHSELDWHFRYPASEIQRALEQAVRVTPGNRPQTRLYVGPIVTPDGRYYEGKAGRPNGRQFTVVVSVEDGGQNGVVITAYAPILRVKGASC